MSTKIQWTDEVWNWLVGCSRISEGCVNCYAAEAAKSPRLQQFGQYQQVKNWDGKIEFVESALMKPLKWRKSKKIFTCSMSDVFHENVPFEWIDRAFAVMAICNHHTFQILTKRPERMKEYFDSKPHERWIKEIWEINTIAGLFYNPSLGAIVSRLRQREPLPNVWLGVTVENQQAAEERIPVLLSTPASVRFLSCEPLLEEVDLSEHLILEYAEWDMETSNPMGGGTAYAYPIDWIICGGESGNNVRECRIEWIESIVHQCDWAGVPCFVKQLGSNCGLKLKSRSGGDIEEFPENLRIRQFPKIKQAVLV